METRWISFEFTLRDGDVLREEPGEIILCLFGLESPAAFLGDFTKEGSCQE